MRQVPPALYSLSYIKSTPGLTAVAVLPTAFTAMATTNKVVLFGDQTVDPYSLIKLLHRQSAHSLVLQTFLQKTYSAVSQELATFEPLDRANFPSFDSIIALAETYSQSDDSNEAISTVLLCVAQLGLLLS